MRVAIIDYGSGNLRSVAKAFEHVAARGAFIDVTSDPAALRLATHIVLPGVGAYADCMHGLKAVPGMLPALEEQVLAQKKNFLGICVGMQMLFESGHEHGIHPGLGWLKGEVVRLTPATALKIPHMGWNELDITRPHPLLNGVGQGAHAYFVHSYHAQCKTPADVLATVAYGQTITAVVGQGHIVGTQFHPEKSQETGLKILKNFLSI
jgi:glutamine amidotransferase